MHIYSTVYTLPIRSNIQFPNRMLYTHRASPSAVICCFNSFTLFATKELHLFIHSYSVIIRCNLIFCPTTSYFPPPKRYERTHSEYVTKLPAGKHSTKGIGSTMPDPSGYKVTKSGVVIPMGKSTRSGAGYTSLLYNEYP